MRFTNGGRTPARDTKADQYVTTPRVYCVTVFYPERNAETVEQYEAASYSEAFAMAERQHAGKADYLFGVPELFRSIADREGIAYNDADGLLV